MESASDPKSHREWPRKEGRSESNAAHHATVCSGSGIKSPRPKEMQQMGDFGVHVDKNDWAQTLERYTDGASVSDPSQAVHATLLADSGQKTFTRPREPAARSIFDVGLSHWLTEPSADPSLSVQPSTALSRERDAANAGYDESFRSQPTPSGLGSSIRRNEANTAAGPATAVTDDDDTIGHTPNSASTTKSARKARTVHVDEPGWSPVTAYVQKKKLFRDYRKPPLESDDEFVKAMEEDQGMPYERDEAFEQYEEDLAEHRAEMARLLGNEAGWIEDAPLIGRNRNR